MGLIELLQFFYKELFSIELPVKIDIPLKEKRKKIKSHIFGWTREWGVSVTETEIISNFIIQPKLISLNLKFLL